MIEISDHPISRRELQGELNLGRDGLIWMRKQFYIFLDDCSHMEKGHPLEPYLVWLFRKFANPPFLLRGKKEGRNRINRRLVTLELQKQPEQYAKAKFLEETSQSHEQTTIIEFNGAYIRQVGPVATQKQSCPPDWN